MLPADRWWAVVLLYPIAEEIVFRGALQPLFLKSVFLSRNLYGFSFANILTSLLFVFAHLFFHDLVWALAVFAPSLIFGFFRDRYGGVTVPIGLHIFYNAGFFGGVFR